MKPPKNMGLRLNHGSVKCSGKNEATKRQGAKQKFGKVNESVPEGMNTQKARGSDKINEIKYECIA
jgi:hypothetical protein